ncbi:hypothetical protein NL529_34535, partial [Klebsiella pneumoniae]|nr:hypothetical protein [Klebsiella pneumoniae]
MLSNNSLCSTKKYITRREYSNYRLQIRENQSDLNNKRSEFATMHRSGRLWQEYIVDSWMSIEESRLNYFRLSQQNFR